MQINKTFLNLFLVLTLFGACFFTKTSFAGDQDVVLKFHDLIAEEEYEKAYQVFSHRLQNSINLVEMIELFYHFDQTYGKEIVFDGGRVIRDKLEEGGELTTYEYVSKRTSPIFYAFNVSEEYGELKITSFKFFVPQDKWAKEYVEN
jgi:hypothetical protein